MGWRLPVRRGGVLLAGAVAIGTLLGACGEPRATAPPPVTAAATAVAQVSATPSPEATATTTTAAPSPTPAGALTATPSLAPEPTVTARPTETPTPTATAAPPTETPAPTATAAPPTETPTPAGVTVEDFNPVRFLRDVARNPPDGVVMRSRMVAPEGAGTTIIEYAMRPADEASRLRFEIEAEELKVIIELITIGERSYLGGETGGQKVEWVTAILKEGEASFVTQFAGGGSADVSELLSLDWRAVAVEPCGDGRTCFVLENSEQPETQMWVDAKDYLPVKTVRSVPSMPEPIEALIDWDVPVEITPPGDAREVTADELGFMFFALMLPTAPEEGSTAPTPTAGPGGDSGS